MMWTVPSFSRKVATLRMLAIKRGVTRQEGVKEWGIGQTISHSLEEREGGRESRRAMMKTV
jgi:hypothetical protein